jgi:hypothetical protein
LFYWASSSLQATDPSLLEVGLETFFTIVFHGGVQRTYGHDGSLCQTSLKLKDKVFFHLGDTGILCLYIICITQLIFSIISFLACAPWFLSVQNCYGPGIRTNEEFTYFTIVLADSQYSNMSGYCNAPNYGIWQFLDVEVCVGESIQTIEEDCGIIIMDKKKLVRPLLNGRKYS